MPLRVISLGWGIQSWTLVAMAALGELPPVDYAIHADTTWEHAHTYAHAQRWTAWLGEHGVTVVTVTGKPSRTAVVNEYNTGTQSVLIPAFSTDHATGKRGQVKRQCTHDWKIMPIRRFLRQVLKAEGIQQRPGAVHSLQGISYEEWRRMRTSDVQYIENVYPLVDLRMTRAGCVAWLQGHGLDVPAKSSCVFCPYKNLESWRALKRGAGVDWETAVSVDRTIRTRRPICDLFVHPARAPLPEAIRIPADVGAEQLEFEMPCDAGVCWV